MHPSTTTLRNRFDLTQQCERFVVDVVIVTVDPKPRRTVSSREVNLDDAFPRKLLEPSARVPRAVACIENEVGQVEQRADIGGDERSRIRTPEARRCVGL